MLTPEQLVQQAKQYPDLDVYLYALIHVAHRWLPESTLTYKSDALYLDYDRGRYRFLQLTPRGLELPRRVWNDWAARALKILLLDTRIDSRGYTDIIYLWVTYSKYTLRSLKTTHRLLPCDMLLDVWREIDSILACPTYATRSTACKNPEPIQPNYGDAEGSGINVHSQGEFYPLYHMYWRGQDWLCYAGRAVPAEQHKHVLLGMERQARKDYVACFGVEIQPKLEERGAKSSVWPLEIRDDGKHGVVFTWGNRWMPYAEEYHKYLETRTEAQRLACIQVIGEVLS